MFDRLIKNWVYGGFLSGILLLLLAPILLRSWPAALVPAFLLLPAYMLHQYEEHDKDRFRLFFNKTIGRGQDVLSPLAVFVTNVPGVWGVIGISLWLAFCFNVGFALIAVYLVLVNAAVHVIHAIAFRGYNPGLATAIAIFLPLGIYTWMEIQKAGGGTIAMHVLGLIVAVGLHAAILLHVARQGHRSNI